MRFLIVALGAGAIASAICGAVWLCLPLAVCACVAWSADTQEIEAAVDAIEAELARVDEVFRRSR